jgi:hypothetical protein
MHRWVVTLVGSVAQEQDWHHWAEVLTKEGFVVFEAGSYDKNSPAETWNLITRVHQRKIEISDIVGVIRKPDGSVGEHTKADIAYGYKHNKRVAKVESLLNGVLNDW